MPSSPKVKLTIGNIRAMEAHQSAEMGRPVKDKPSRKPQFRWNTARDTSLLIEVEAVKPFSEIGSKGVDLWSKIADVINSLYASNVDHIGVKNHFSLLLENFRKEDFKARYRTGTDEEVTEIKDRLARLLQETEECKRSRLEGQAQSSKKADEDKEKGEMIRGAALNGRTLEKDDERPKKKRLSDNSLLDMWYEKQQADSLMATSQIEKEDKRHEMLSDKQKDREIRTKRIGN